MTLCQGDCDSDDDCVDDLVCFQRDHGSSMTPPGCEGTPYGDNWDYCADPTWISESEITSNNASVRLICYDWGALSISRDNGDTFINEPLTSGLATKPFVYIGDDPTCNCLDECEGDCDSDSDCIDDLVCWDRHDDGTSNLPPGCSGTVNGPNSDYCYDPEWTDDGYTINNYTITNVNESTVLRFSCRGSTTEKGFIASVNYQNTIYSTTNPLEDGIWRVVYSSDNIVSPLVYNSSLPNLSNYPEGIANDAYLVWNNQNTMNTMVFQFDFGSIDNLTSSPTAQPTSSPISHSVYMVSMADGTGCSYTKQLGTSFANASECAEAASNRSDCTSSGTVQMVETLSKNSSQTP